MKMDKELIQIKNLEEFERLLDEAKTETVNLKKTLQKINEFEFKIK